MRIHELAKELGLSSKDILDRLHKHGVEAKSHMSKLDDDAVKLIRDAAAPVAAPSKKTSAPSPKAAPDPVQAPAPATATPPVAAHDKKPAPKPKETPLPKPAPAPAPKAPPTSENTMDGKVIRVRGSIVVKELADMLGLRPNQIISELMSLNILASINQRVDIHEARKIAEKHGFTLEQEKRAADHRQAQEKRSPDEIDEDEEDKPEDLITRAPVVTFLGHVDHGKTSLLDKIRKTTVAKGESGGITQHIGAYTVKAGGRSITFLDTPGHAAFTSMRARGANLTDIAVIIIAADDGIMPQTREAIMHAKAANVAIMVAINKIDLPGAAVDRVKQQLQAENLSPEDWGGETICVPVSAATGEGVEHLLEMILLQADVMELKANPKRFARGFVIEARMQSGMGPTANLLITNGTLSLGNIILCGKYCGRVRALINDHGVKVKSAGPSTPIQCLGMPGIPEAGAAFRVYVNEKTARALAEERGQTQKSESLILPRKATLDGLFDQLKQNEKMELRIVVKADTQGSAEAITQALHEIKSDKIAPLIILCGMGNITENDIMLASASQAVILGFHVGKEPGTDALAKHERVEIRTHKIIYELLDEVQNAMVGLLPPEIRETVKGHAEVRQVFPLGKTTRVAGCMVMDGTISAKHRVRIKRNKEVVYENASVESLRRFQDTVSEVRESQECGIRLEKSAVFEEGDILEFYELQKVSQTL